MARASVNRVDTINVPQFDLVNDEFAVREMRGCVEARNATKIYYKPREEPIDASVSIPIANDLTAPPLQQLRDVLTAGGAGDAVVRSFLLTDRGYPFEYTTTAGNMPTLTKLTDDEFVGDHTEADFYLGFVFNGSAYLLSSNWEIFQASSDAQLSDLTEVESTILDALGLANISTDAEPKAVSVFQNRVWIAVGQNIIWCDTNDLSEWRPSYLGGEDTDPVGERPTITTNAGHQLFNESSPVLDIKQNGDTIYIFLDDVIYKTEVLDVDTQFGFTPITSDIHYQGGATATRVGLVFFASDGMYQMTGTELQKLSETLGDVLLDVENFGYITSVVHNDTVFFGFTDHPNIVAYNFTYGTINTFLHERCVLAELSDSEPTIGDLGDTPIGDIDRSIGDLGGESGMFPYSITDRPTADGDFQRHEFGLLQNNFVRFIYYADTAGERTWVKSIRVPELDDFRVSVIQSTDAWSGGIRKAPNRQGVVQIQRPYRSPRVEISGFSSNFSRIDIETNKDTIGGQ